MGSINVGISGFFSMDDNPGESFVPDISLLHRTDDGPFELYKCSGMGRITVLKAIRLGDRDNPICREMLRKEYEIGISLNHPNIREYYSMRDFPGLGTCIEMEWVDAVTLEEITGECRRNSRLCDSVVSQILDAVRHLHMKQVVHRDLKPSNILVTRKGMNVKIIDFSLSDSDSHLILKGNAGTPMYASPEQLGCRESDYLSDIYSLGVILRQLSSRRRYRLVAARCMKENPADRFPGIDALRTELFRPSRAPWYAAYAIALTMLIAAFAFMSRSMSGSRDIVPPVREVTAPAEAPSPAREAPALSEGEGSAGQRNPAPSPQERKSGEKAVDASVIDDIFREATDLFEGME